MAFSLYVRDDTIFGSLRRVLRNIVGWYALYVGIHKARAVDVSAACFVFPPRPTKKYEEMDFCQDLRLGSQYLPRYDWLNLPDTLQQHLHIRYQQCQHEI
eukprot:1154045-Pelagomonas_calceolata.AAC.6